MHILLCNERFLFRYGVDRVLLILADYLREQGNVVSIMGVNIDTEVARNVVDHVVLIPANDDYYNINEHVSTWLEQNWDTVFDEIGKPDLALVCGWPFFTSIPLLRIKTKGVIFHDYGIVPVYQYQGGTLKIQEKVRALRRKYMPCCSYVITISDYVTQTTYEIKPYHNVPIKTIHLGANHMEMNLWNPTSVGNTASFSSVSERIDELQRQQRQIILNLGRWESSGYKNSPIMFNVMREICKREPNAVLLVLAERDGIDIPQDLKEKIFPLGFVSDEDLVYVMKKAHLGIAPTLWEGFNLPLAEMQYYEKPVLVFDIGAHPEVIFHPWYLCGNGDELVDKACLTLEGRDLPQKIKQNAYARFKEYFTWERCTEKCYEVFEKLLAQDVYSISSNRDFSLNAVKTETIIMDMTNPSHDPANPGIIRVCRCLAATMQYYMDPVFVIWSEPDKAYVLPTQEEYHMMGTFNGPILFDHMRLSPDEYRIPLTTYLKRRTPKKIQWLFLPDIIFMDRGEDIRRYCRENHFEMADIFYDDIPYRMDDIYDVDRQDEHAKYMIRLADSVFISSISQYSTNCLQHFYKKTGITNANIVTLEIPGEFKSVQRVVKEQIPENDEIQFICVSTLEPRKNHRTLIDACLLLEKSYPDLKFRLVMIGNKYPGHFDIAEYAGRVSKEHKCIQYLGVVSDEVMQEEIRKSAFTVYPSIMEGYGMPIAESLWQGKPCLCSGDGAMGEIAKGGGCYTVDITNIHEVADALYLLCTNHSLVHRLTTEAVTRKIVTWEEYAESTLMQFVLEERNLLGSILADIKFGKKFVPIYEKSLMQTFLCELAQDPFACIVVSIGINDKEILNILDKKADLVIAYMNVEWDSKEKQRNLILVPGEYNGLECVVEKQCTKNDGKILKLICDAKNTSKDEWAVIRSEHLYDAIWILHAENSIQMDGYDADILDGGVALLRKRI